MSKQQWNTRLAKARLSTEVSLGNRSELRKVQEAFADTQEEPVTSALEELIAMLPEGCWSLNNIRGILSLNLHTHQLHSTPCQFIRSFEGRTASELKQKYCDWKHLEDTRNHPTLFD